MLDECEHDSHVNMTSEEDILAVLNAARTHQVSEGERLAMLYLKVALRAEPEKFKAPSETIALWLHRSEGEVKKIWSAFQKTHELPQRGIRLL